ncbi:NADH-quinone oxidoreductase subunit NuoE [Orrella sp. 11846]|uniref:NADH-quinone oxidoreductase subunit NuoE n=1 Tax=Orrella sp. 11846 TaxID=3409913 RepID=UPI003B5D05E6
MLLSEDSYRKIDRELTKFPPEQKRSAIMAALTIAQEELGWISTDVITDIAQYLDLPAIMIQEVATFYDMYDLKPVGRVKVTVCTNLPCALREGVQTADYLKKKLGIDFGETTPDGQFTLTEGECMGSCGDAPVLLVNNHHMCIRMTQERLDEMLEDLSKIKEAE